MWKNKALLAMIVVQFAYAGMTLFSKAAIAKGMNPFIFVAYRQAFATLALFPFAFFLERFFFFFFFFYIYICNIINHVLHLLFDLFFSPGKLIHCHTAYCGRSFWFLYLGTQHFWVIKRIYMYIWKNIFRVFNIFQDYS